MAGVLAHRQKTPCLKSTSRSSNVSRKSFARSSRLPRRTIRSRVPTRARSRLTWLRTSSPRFSGFGMIGASLRSDVPNQDRLTDLDRHRTGSTPITFRPRKIGSSFSASPRAGRSQGSKTWPFGSSTHKAYPQQRGYPSTMRTA